MNITECDICKKTIARGSDSFRLTRSGNIMTYASFEFCSSCSKPILKILKDNKLIKDDNKKNGGKK
jgi:hypothetical protein